MPAEDKETTEVEEAQQDAVAAAKVAAGQSVPDPAEAAQEVKPAAKTAVKKPASKTATAKATTAKATTTKASSTKTANGEKAASKKTAAKKPASKPRDLTGEDIIAALKKSGVTADDLAQVLDELPNEPTVKTASVQSAQARNAALRSAARANRTSSNQLTAAEQAAGRTRSGAGLGGQAAPQMSRALIGVITGVVVVVFALGLILGNFFQLPSCSASPAANEDQVDTGSSATASDVDPNLVAATVGDMSISEKSIATIIDANYRTDSNGVLLPADEWAAWLVSYDVTPETFREDMIRSYALPMVVLAEAASQGIYPDTAVVEEELAYYKSDMDEAAWQDWLTSYSLDSEEIFRINLQADNVYQTLIDANLDITLASLTSAEKNAYLVEQAPSYVGMRASLIYLPYATEDYGSTTTDVNGETIQLVSAEETKVIADELYARLQAGEDFATVADEANFAGATDAGGDIGWGAETALANGGAANTAVALQSLELGAFSEPIDEGYAYFIVQYTGLYSLPEDGTVDVDAIPEEVRQMLLDDLATSTYTNSMSTSIADKWLVINPMPAGLPYDVDMSLVDIDITDTVLGSGEVAEEGDYITVNYTGMLESGSIFDSSEGNPVGFDLSYGSVIAGWVEGVAGMQVGGKRTLVIPAAMAYGSTGSGGTDVDGDGVMDTYVVPPNAVLTFEVELVSVEKAAE